MTLNIDCFLSKGLNKFANDDDLLVKPVSSSESDIESVDLLPTLQHSVVFGDGIANQHAASTNSLPEYSDCYLDHISECQTDTQPDSQSDSQIFDQTNRQTTSQPNRKTTNQIAIQPTATHEDVSALFRDPAYGLTKNRCKVLLYLISQNGFAQRKLISQHTGVAFGTVKDALNALVTKKYISKPNHLINGDMRGFTYAINRPLCDHFLKMRSHEFFQINNQTTDHISIQSYNQPDIQPCSYSSRYFKQPTTKDNPAINDPEFGFWSEAGVTERQLKTWENEFQIDRNQLLQSMRYCRHDLLYRHDKKKVKSPVNWFYAIMRKNGHYARPADYKSLRELIVDNEKNELELLRKQALQLSEIRKKKEQAKIELKFQEIISDDNSAEYQSLIIKLDNNFAKEVGGDILEVALRQVFLKENGIAISDVEP